MTPATARGLVRRVGPDPDPGADADLVARFARHADPAAFAALVRRHGPMVLAACRRMLPDPADADDAFQAVFLVLVRKAGAVRPPGAVGGWLHGVAVRTAQKARVAAARRRRREMMSVLAGSGTASPGRVPGESSLVPGSPEHAELRTALDEELARLPDPLRAAVVLCDLGGKTRAEASADLGCPEGTVAARLHRARKLLAERLARRGVTAPAALASAVTTVPGELFASVAGFASGGPVPPAVRTLAEGVVRSMVTNPLSVAFAAVAAVALAAGAGVLWAAGAPLPEAAPVVESAEAADPPAGAGASAVVDVSFSAGGSRYVVVAGGKAVVKDAATDKVSWIAPAEAARFTSTPAGRDDVIVLTAEGVVMRGAVDGVPHGRTAPRPKTDETWQRVRFSADTTKYAAHTGAGVRVYETSTGNEAVKLAEQYAPDAGPAPVVSRDVFFSPNGEKVFGLGVLVEPRNMGASEWGVAAGNRGHAMGGSPRPTAATYSPDGKTLAVAYPEFINLWTDPPLPPPVPEGGPERTSLRPPKQLAPSGPVTALAFSPDGKTVAVGVHKVKEGPATRVDLHDAATGKFLRYFVGFAADPAVTALAFSPDGKTLLAGTAAGEVKRFDVAMPPPPLTGNVSDLSFAPDGKTYLVVAGGKAMVMDAVTDKVLWTAPAEAARFTSGGDAVVTMGKAAERRAAATGQVQTEGPRPKTELGWHLFGFSPEGARYAAHFGFEARVYDVATGAEPFRLQGTFGPPGGSIYGIPGKNVFFSPNGKLIAAVGVMVSTTDMGVAVWDADGGKRVFLWPPVTNSGVREATTAAAFSADGKTFAVALGKSIDLFETTRWVERVRLDDLPGSGRATALAFSPDGKQLAVGYQLPLRHGGDKGKEPRVTGYKTEVLVLDPSGKEKAVRRFDGFEGVNHMGPTKLPVAALAFSPDGKTLLAGTGLTNMTPAPDGPIPAGEVKRFTLAIADPPAEKVSAPEWRERASLPAFDDRVQSVAFNPNGKALVVGGRGGAGQITVTMWDAATAKQLWAGGVVPAGTTGVSFSPDGRLLAATRDKVTGLFNPANGQTVLMNPPLPGGRAVAFNPASERVAGQARHKLAVTDGRAVSVVEWAEGPAPGAGTATFGPLKNPPTVEGELPVGVAFAPDGKQLVYIPNHKIGPDFFAGKLQFQGEATHWVAHVWGGGSGAAMAPLPHGTEPVTAVAWSPDGKRIATGCRKGDVVVWDAATFKELRRTRIGGRGGEGIIHALAFAANGKALAVAVDLVDAKGAERVVMLDPATGTRLGKDLITPMTPVALAFAPDGKTLAVGCADFLPQIQVPPGVAQRPLGQVKLYTIGPVAAPVTTIGKHLNTDGTEAVEVLPLNNGRHTFRLTVSHKSGSYTHTLADFARSGDPWFAYAESATRVWAFNGRDELALHLFHDSGRLDGSTYAASFTSGGTPGIVGLAPAVVRDLLPAAFRDRFDRPR